MKKRKIYVVLPVLLCAALTAAYVAFFVIPDDRKAPEIHVDSEILRLSVTADEKAFKKGVTATDDKDGDVTDGILVEGFSTFIDENTVNITYAAYDSAGNVSKAVRKVQFTDYEPPKFVQTEGLVFASNTSPDVLSFMSAEDKLDGDIGSRVKGTLLSESTSINYPGLHQVEFRVTNSLGDTRYITLPVEVYQAGDYNAKVELSEYLVYLKKGQEFVPESYLRNLIVGTREYSLENQNPVVAMPAGQEDIRTYINRYISPKNFPSAQVSIVNVDMKSNVDVNTPGLYSVTYEVDYEERYVGYTRLNVIVEE